ncbi:hypothetical protein PLIIFM63780_008803 [Purpureocillium lilacinum]|nr:hypothetical protein PLIIFM63780_008803 [Purpureocillium lilacinum]
MMLKSLVATAAVAANYHCLTTNGTFTIQQRWADDAFRAGGTAPTRSGYPHAFNGRSGGPTSAQLKFLGADPRCNERNPKLFEYPIMKNGSPYPRDRPHGTTGTPVRVVYLQDGTTLCGVMAHVIEDKNDHHGSGDFRVCDK